MPEVRIKRLHHFTLAVRDLDRATGFWTEVMGGQLLAERNKYKSVRASVRLPNTPEDGPLVELFVQPHGQPLPEWYHPHYAFEVEAADFPSVMAHLDSHGVPYDGPRTFANPEHAGHSHAFEGSASLYFEDQDGNHLEFHCISGYPDPNIAFGGPDRTHLGHEWPKSKKLAP